MYNQSKMGLLKLATQIAKSRGQDGGKVSEGDMQKALEMIQKNNKKFMTGS